MTSTPSLPWGPSPLMLAPMQGLTNRGMRAVFGELVQPDVLFTEFVRVRPKSDKPVAESDFIEATTGVEGIPLVVQVIGSADEGVLEATRDLVGRGVKHINVNMGCPWGRMTSVLAGGGMFRAPETVEPMLKELRAIVPGTLSVKTRSGIDDERQIFKVFPAFEAAGVDFAILHARTVKQKYKGRANHDLTKELVVNASIPVIANGDVRSREDAERVLAHTEASGLMLGRGAVADPWLFHQIRGLSDVGPRLQRTADFLIRVLDQYERLFEGDAQVLAKLGKVLQQITDPSCRKLAKVVKKQKRVAAVREVLVSTKVGSA